MISRLITGTQTVMTSPVRPRRRPGRQSKGARHPITVRLPAHIYEQVAELARGEGVPTGDYLTRVVAEAHGHRAPAYCYPSPTNQEELPIDRAS